MSPKYFLMISLLLAAVVGINADDDAQRKMSAYVKQAVGETVMTKTRSADVSTTDGRTMTVFLLVDGDVDRLLAANGCKVLDRQDDIIIASVPLDKLSVLAASKSIRRIDASKPCRVTLDSVVTNINAVPIYEGQSLPQAYTGKGVVLGIEDIGFDFTHPTFLDSSTGQTRVSAYWDQLTTDTVGSTLYVGRDYTTPEEIAAKKTSTDFATQYHGSHTLGIAAGNGAGTKYRGIAYESDICAVSNYVGEYVDSADIYKYTSATASLGFKYIFDKAAEAGKPCVISFSEGLDFMESSEDSIWSAYMGKLTGPGRIFVVSAGNDGDYMRYVNKPKGKQQAGTYIVLNGDSSVFYARSHDRFNLRFVSYGAGKNDTLTISSDSFSKTKVDSMVIYGDNQENDTLWFSKVSYPSSFTPGDTIYKVVISATDIYAINNAGILAVAAEGSDADVELIGLSSIIFANGKEGSEWRDAEYGYTIKAPACYETAIAVGATAHRTQVVNSSGKILRTYGTTDKPFLPGKLAYYSSNGPGARGIVKPDVTAPGSNIISAGSSYCFNSYYMVDSLVSNGRTYPWVTLQGTSMACPVVAGTVALWLQADPTLTPEKVMDIIAHTSSHPDADMEYPNNDYGYGDIDAYRGLLYLLGLDGIEGISADHPNNVTITVNASGQLSLDFAKTPTQPIVVSVYSVGGVKLQEHSLPAGSSVYNLPLPSAPAVYAVQVTSSEPGCTGSTLVRVN